MGLQVILILLLSAGVLSKDILVLLPFPGYSHTMPFMPIFKELGRRGHNVTMVTPFPQEPTPKGFNQITVPINSSHMINTLGWDIPALGSEEGLLSQLKGVWKHCPHFTPYFLDNVLPYLPHPESKFDLIIMEPFFCMEPLLAASHVYKAPIVATLPIFLLAPAALATGNPLSISYVPNEKLPQTNRMSFMERVRNTVVVLTEVLVYHLHHYPRQDQLMREYFPDPHVPYVTDLLKNVSLILTSTHFSLAYPRPYARNILEVGGVGIADVKPLPKDLEKFFSDAEDGVILFSWGSYIQLNNIDDILKNLMKTFSRIKQKVLFKWAHASIPDTPDNVLVRKWLPQLSILAHNKTVAFISHCGMNSIYEATFFGVPVIGTPIFGDQPYNIRLLEDFGMAIRMNIPDLKTDNNALFDVIKEVTTNPSYKANAVKRSAMLSDRPMPPLEEAVYWIEYIMRYGGDHLQPAARGMPWYSLALIDVWAFILTITAAILYVLWKSVRITLALCCKGGSKARLGKEKKQN